MDGFRAPLINLAASLRRSSAVDDCALFSRVLGPQRFVLRRSSETLGPLALSLALALLARDSI